MPEIFINGQENELYLTQMDNNVTGRDDYVT